LKGVLFNPYVVWKSPSLLLEADVIVGVGVLLNIAVEGTLGAYFQASRMEGGRYLKVSEIQ
jgi:hypothetical protein